MGAHPALPLLTLQETRGEDARAIRDAAQGPFFKLKLSILSSLLSLSRSLSLSLSHSLALSQALSRNLPPGSGSRLVVGLLSRIIEGRSRWIHHALRFVANLFFLRTLLEKAVVQPLFRTNLAATPPKFGPSAKPADPPCTSFRRQSLFPADLAREGCRPTSFSHKPCTALLHQIHTVLFLVISSVPPR